MKKVIRIFLLGIISLSTCCTWQGPEESYTAEKTYYWGENTPTILTIGDSIASGVGLDSNKKRFSSLLASETNTIEKNKAVSGNDTYDLIKQLKRLDDTQYDVIFLSIGANDILTIAKSKFAAYQDILSTLFENSSFFEYAKTLIYIAKDYNSKETQAIFEEGIQLFENDFATLLEDLPKKYPNTPIFIQTIYNPYVGFWCTPFLDVEGVSDGYITRINNIIEEKCESNDFLYLVDVYTAFKKSNKDLINAKFALNSSIELDPHPNEEGHIVIKNAYLKAWEDTNYIRRIEE